MAIASDGLKVIPLHGLPAVQPGDDIAHLVIEALRRASLSLESGDVLVVAQKVVSKAEGALVSLADVVPGSRARELAELVHKDPRLVEVILSQTARIVRAVPGVLITETHHGFICANAGVDASNSIAEDTVVLLPQQPDTSAQHIRDALSKATGIAPAIVISDTFNRPWREGSMNVAIGTAGFVPIDDSRGLADDNGRILHATLVSVADEIASAAQLVMGETGGIPAAFIRGLQLQSSNDGSQSLLRDPERDLFR